MGGFAEPLSYIAQGRAQDRAYSIEAKQAEMQGQAQSNERLRALNDALSAQQAMFGAQGRVGNVGSAQAVQQGDIAKGLEDISMIKAGAKSKSSDLLLAGRLAKQQGYTKAYISLANSGQKAMAMGG